MSFASLQANNLNLEVPSLRGVKERGSVLLVPSLQDNDIGLGMDLIFLPRDEAASMTHLRLNSTETESFIALMDKAYDWSEISKKKGIKVEYHKTVDTNEFTQVDFSIDNYGDTFVTYSDSKNGLDYTVSTQSVALILAYKYYIEQLLKRDGLQSKDSLDEIFQ